MQATVIPGVYMWSAWQPDRNLYFNSFFIKTDDGNLVVDPLAGDEALFAHLGELGGIDWIVVTNRDHERATAAFAERFGANVAASAGDAPLLAVTVERELREDDRILGARVLAFDGLKTAGEIALAFPALRTVIVGDALWGDPAGSLRLMPKVADPATAILSLRKLAVPFPKHVLVGDGTCVFENAFDTLWRTFESHRDLFVHRVNLDELPMDVRGDGKYAVAHAEIGFLIGAKTLGYRVAMIPPGKVFSPLHWHSIEEELFIVWDGEPSIRTLDGTHRLRRGDLVSFPTRPEGAHQLVNESDAPATLILVSNTDSLDDCFYPDSRKVLVGKTDLIVRDNPELDYYDGE